MSVLLRPVCWWFTFWDSLASLPYFTSGHAWVEDERYGPLRCERCGASE